MSKHASIAKTTTLILTSFSLCFSLLFANIALANSIESSTMYFVGTLTDNGDGTYSGVLPMIKETDYTVGDGVDGYDVYGKEGATAWFGDNPGPAWTPETIVGHDAWPTYPTDTPDWYQYSLEFDGNSWAVRNHPGATDPHPWSDEAYWGAGGKPPAGVPMSGSMNWAIMYAKETDVGAYLPATGVPEIPGGAATQGGGPQAWDMDWSWGSEVVPLEYPGFRVEITDLTEGVFQVALIPAPMPVSTPSLGPAFMMLMLASIALVGIVKIKM